MEIKKEDLVLTHYSWSNDPANPRQDMTPTRNTFDRDNGAHVLWIVNWYMGEYPASQKRDIATLELLLSDKLPSGLMSEKSVCNWLANT